MCLKTQVEFVSIYQGQKAKTAAFTNQEVIAYLLIPYSFPPPVFLLIVHCLWQNDPRIPFSNF